MTKFSTFISLIAALISSKVACAEALAPELVVQSFIEAVKEKELKSFKSDLESMVDQKRTAFTVERLENLLAKVDPSKIRFGTKAEGKAGVVHLKMTDPVKLLFTLQHQNGVLQKVNHGQLLQFRGKGDYYKIIAIE